MEKFIKECAQNLKKLIEKYEYIAIFRHKAPDFDALGSQFGLANFIKENYPNKKVYVLGENHKSLTGKLFKETDIIDDEVLFAQPFLAIILDSGDSARISDSRFLKADVKFKIDHHPEVDKYGDFNYVNTESSSTAQIICQVLTSKEFKKSLFSKETARYLAIGIIGDSGRFLHRGTTQDTFACASTILDTGLNLQKEVYIPMYMKTSQDLKISAHVLTNFKMSEHGVAYYILDNDFLTKFNITPERGKENINMLSNIEDIFIWVSFSQDLNDNNWHVSIRSREVAVNEVAAKFHGGGHKNASGAVVNTLEEAQELINELDKLLI